MQARSKKQIAADRLRKIIRDKDDRIERQAMTIIRQGQIIQNHLTVREHSKALFIEQRDEIERLKGIVFANDVERQKETVWSSDVFYLQDPYSEKTF